MVDLVLVNGLPGSGKTTLATQLAQTLQAQLISKDAIKEAVADVVAAPARALGMASSEMMWALAAAMTGTLVLESWWFTPRDLPHVEAGLRRCTPSNVIEVWCDVPPHIAKARYAARTRHRIHQDQGRLTDAWPLWESQASPLNVGTTLRVNTNGTVDLVDLADRITEAMAGSQRWER